MSGWKDKIFYDSTTPADGDTIGAYLHATNALTSTTIGSDEALDVMSYVVDDAGTQITGTTVGADHGLDVNVLNDLTAECDLDGVYNVSTNADPDNVGLISHVRAASPADANQTFRSTGGAASSDAVVAANVHGIDVNAFGMAYNGTTWDRILKDGTSDGLLVHLAGNDVDFTCVGNVADDAADSGNPLKVGSRATDAALTELSAADDRADMISDIYRRVYTTSAPNVSMGYGAATVGTSAGVLVAANSGRQIIRIQNLENKDIYIGGDASVTTSNGFRIAGQSSDEIEIGEFIPVYAIGEAASMDVRYMQLA